MDTIKDLIEAAENIERLFSYEDEGPSAGRPKPCDWQDARIKLSLAIAAAKWERLGALIVSDEAMAVLESMPWPERRNGFDNLTQEWHEWNEARIAVIARR